MKTLQRSLKHRSLRYRLQFQLDDRNDHRVITRKPLSTDCAEEEMENVAMIITPECTALLFGPGPLSHFYSGQLLAFSLHGNYQS